MSNFFQDILNGTKRNREQFRLKNFMDYDEVEMNLGILHDMHDEDNYLLNSDKNISYRFKVEENQELLKIKNKFTHFHHFMAGGIAGCFSRTMTAPLERLKILYQVNYQGKNKKPPGIIEGLKEVYLRDGIKGLFRGNLINLLKSTPDTAIKFYMFEKSKTFLTKNYGDKLSNGNLFVAGAVAGVSANILIFPLDVIKTRLSASPNGAYKGILDTALKLYTEGGFRIFYKGVDACICCAVPNSGLNLTFYELLKRTFSGSKAQNNSSLLSTPMLMMIGGLSAMISSTILYPFQTIQSRIIMLKSPKNEASKYLNPKTINQTTKVISIKQNNIIFTKKLNMLHIIQSTLEAEGFRGFFKGYKPGITKIVIGNAISFGLYENIRSILN